MTTSVRVRPRPRARRAVATAVVALAATGAMSACAAGGDRLPPDPEVGEDVAKKNFPTDTVYGDTTRPEPRLPTCGGDIEDGHRTNNVIFYGDLVA
ncbi:hypothetical protein [Streptomyces sp. G-G2]|uniref:hypothetical protein n=1 Tax=Streptomyces sp. G-G2 TaxID=3046201 RepID=UPI0032D960C4